MVEISELDWKFSIRMNKKLLAEIIRLNSKKVPFCTVSKIEEDQVEIVPLNHNDKSDIQELIMKALDEDKLIVVEYEGNETIINPYNTPLNLIIVGAVHISQYLSKIAKLMDFDVTIIDPREAFASKERFPNDKVINSWPEDCFSELNIDNRTAIVTLTHEPNLDDPAITFAIKSSCFYIGALGSKKTHKNRIERLVSLGFSDDEIRRVNGPIGLPINASKPNEIAISIMAEIIAALRHNNFLDSEIRHDWKLR